MTKLFFLLAVFAASQLALAGDTFVSLECPLLLGGGVKAIYYENGAPKCGAMTLSITAPDGSSTTVSSKAYDNGVHVF